MRPEIVTDPALEDAVQALFLQKSDAHALLFAGKLLAADAGKAQFLGDGHVAIPAN